MVVPYKDREEGKKEQVAEMFDNISHRYDFLNHFLSLGIDKLWRKKAIKLVKDRPTKQVLDVATGTGDFAIEALKLNPDHITGIDISAGMLSVGREKMKKRSIDDRITMTQADSENLPFEENSFDLITVGFGVRNFENLEKGLLEMKRVLNNNGVAAILEFSKPTAFPIKQIYGFYFKYILPTIGKSVSKDSSAYQYLPDSVAAFPEGEAFGKILSDLGYKNVRVHRLLFGVSSIYLAEK